MAPWPPTCTSGTATASRIWASLTRSSDTGVLVRPWTLPTATARASTPVRSTTQTIRSFSTTAASASSFPTLPANTI